MPALIKEAGTAPVELVRGDESAWLVSPQQAADRGLNLDGVPSHGIADARPVLGDLVALAAAGAPQVLRRHKTPVAVLIAVPTSTPENPTATGESGGTAGALRSIIDAQAILALTCPDPAAARTALTAHLDTPHPAIVWVTPEPVRTPSAVLRPLFAGLGLDRLGRRPRALGDTADMITAELGRRSCLVVVLDAHRLSTEALESLGSLWAHAHFPLVLAGTEHLDSVLARPALASLKSHVQRHRLPAPVTAGADPEAASPPAGADTRADNPAATPPTPPTDTAAGVGAVVPESLPSRRRRITPLGDALDALLPAVPAGDGDATAHGAGEGLPTGIHVLDTALGRLQPGRFYLVAGAPGTGSSLIATAAARATALTLGRPVLYAASGLTRADVAARVIAAQTPVDYRRLRAGALDDSEREAVAATAELLTAAPLLIDDGTDLDAAALTDTATDVPDLALLVVDRLQAARDPRLPLSGPPAVRDAVQALAHLARTHHLPVLAALDTDDPTLLRTLTADLTLLLEPHRGGRGRGHEDQVRVTITERDLGELATVVLCADLAHARLTDPATPAATVPRRADELAATALPSPDDPAVTTDPAAAEEPDAVTDEAAGDRDTAATDTAVPAEDQPDLVDPATWRPVPTSQSRTAAPAQSGRPRQPAGQGPATSSPYGGRDYDYYLEMISSVVAQALEEHGGDSEDAIAVLEAKAIPNGMALFEATRVGGNYEHTVYPEKLSFLSKKTAKGADEVWEGRHKWENDPLMAELRAGTRLGIAVDVLDTNAAYLSAFKTYLPIGALQHQPDGGFDPRRSGIYLLPKRPAWNHPHLPDPIGNRHEPGPLLLDDATVRLLIRCHKLGLAEAPHITEAWTSGNSESLLEKFRRILNLARDTAITEADQVTEAYVKAIYAKFTSTIGESSYNRDLRRPDWMHIIRSQAFANLWYKALRAHKAGLTIVRLRGTDELHVTDGEWRKVQGRTGGVFEEGRKTTQMKLKKQYTLGKAA
ncbi:DnaB-like helicase C-terminal domain-containing protein [Kitasatospora sp. NPDC056181]|uniref:DnaB-like helicase C-terminal domain-containing protein n=1 Tax=Kitasatospora sp. NPDC056181 TaxID=3345737 RepID=UPI0035D74F27